ncbi:MAG: zf-TFIIB domain-containing protein [Blastocatellia bacterium]
MSKIWNEREKALEEEYFRRKEQELIEKLRARRAEEEKAEASIIHCPRCEGTLVELSFEDVQIDRCNKCNGVWLDAGELEQLTKKDESQGWLNRMWRNVAGE